MDKDEEYSMEEYKEPKLSLRGDHEFYHEDDCLIHTCVQIKRKANKKEELWDVLIDRLSVMKILATDLTESQIKSLRTPEGLNKVITVIKAGKFSLKEITSVL